MSSLVEESAVRLQRARRAATDAAATHQRRPGPAPLALLHASVGNRRLSRALTPGGDGAPARNLLRALSTDAQAATLAQRIEPEEDELEDVNAKHDAQIAQREMPKEEEEDDELKAKHEAQTAQREMPDLKEEEEELKAKHEPRVAQRESPDGEEDEMAARSTAAGGGPAAVLGREGGALGDGLSDQLEGQRGGGSGLRSDIRSRMEGAFGVDFSGVRVHQDGNADALGGSISARAFTSGNDIFLRRNERDSDTSLIAHELAHVVQQSAAPEEGVQSAGMTVGAADDPLELEADRAAQLVSAGASPSRLLKGET